MDDIFTFEIINRHHCFKITISLAELSSHKWIRTVGGCFSLWKSTDYPYILAILNEMSDFCHDASPAFGCTGFHKMKEGWCYAASNLVIYADRLDWGQHMLHEDCHSCKENCSHCHYRLNSSFEGSNVPGKEKIQNIIRTLITKLLKNVNTDLPIIMTALLSGVSSVLSSKGISATPLTLWITGEPGSGKTQLALYMGSFYNKPAQRSDSMFARNYLRANESSKYVRERILKSRNNTVILDDVKAEDSKSLGEHKNTNIDTLVRSIYDHNLSGLPVYSNAIITGEYKPNGNSTLARMILLPLKSFQESPENLESLSFFQDNGYLLTDFQILFLQWVCHELGNMGFLPTLQNEKTRYAEHYIREGFSARSSETLTTLRLGLYLLENFCYEYTSPYFKETILSLVKNGKICFKEAVSHTAYLHENNSTLYATVLSNLTLKDETIRSAPEAFYLGRLNYFNYCVSPMENGIFIKRPAVFLKVPYTKNSRLCQPCLLIRKELLDKFPYELEEHCMRHGVPSTIHRKYNLRRLADHKLLLAAYNRSDSYANNILTYPCADKSSRNISLESFYRINLNNPLLKNLTKELSKREPQAQSIFHESSETEFLYEYGWDNEIYENNEKRKTYAVCGALL